MIEATGRWVPFGPDGSAVPDWMRVAWVDSGDVVYVPGVLTDDSADAVALKAMSDGVSVITDDDGHVYYPIPWLRAEYPAHDGFWARTEARARG